MMNLHAESPYFHLKHADGLVHISGAPDYHTGHVLDTTSRDGVPDGIFCGWHWDGAKLCATTDRYGFSPLYYCHYQDQLFLSTSILQLLKLGAPKDLDHTAIATFLHFNFYVADSSPFKFIKLAPPAAKISWENNQLQVTGGNCFPTGYTNTNTATIVDDYIDLFRQAITRRLHALNPIAVPLSGGLDSRHILFELCRQNRTPDICVTTRHYPPLKINDYEIASRAANLLNINHHLIEPDPSIFNAAATCAIKTNYSTLDNAWFVQLASFLETEKVQSMFDGIGGDLWTESIFKGFPYLNNELTNLVSSILQIIVHQDWIYPIILNNKYFDIFSFETAKGAVIEELQKHEQATNPVVSFQFWNRTRRYISTSPYGIFNNIPTVYAPFLDHDLFDFFASLPASVTNTVSLHELALNKAFPDHQKLGFSSLSMEPVLDTSFYQRWARELLMFISRKGYFEFINVKAIIPRLLSAAVWRNYAPDLRFYLKSLTYLALLEHLLSDSY